MYCKSDTKTKLNNESILNENLLTKKAYELLIKESKEIFEIIEPDGTIVYLSNNSENIIGYNPEERIGENIFDYYHGEELKKIKSMVKFVLNNPAKKIEGTITFISKDGEMIFLEVYMQNLLGEPLIKGIVINCNNITKRVEMEKQMVHISTHDELTELPNRIYFKKKLRLQCEHANKTKRNFAVLMLDIIGFRYINDALGYQFGDMLITRVSQILSTNLDKQIFLCRYSGDRFAIIAENLKTDYEYKSIAKNIIELFGKTTKVDKYEIDINLCIGISIYNNDEDIEGIIKKAEMALFWAKKQGKGNYKVYSSDINLQNYKQFTLRNDLRSALGNNELRVYYQPIVNLLNKEVLAAETLIRWEHPDWGIISPIEFISLAEETGLIINIGYWLIREVCRNYRQWIDEGLPCIKVSVNISGIQFFENNFAENILKIINEFSLSPSFFILEITESIFMLKSSNVIASIEKLRCSGIQIAIDDFGTGYSSLSYFRHFSVDILKIDSSFIKTITSDETSTVITETIIEMAKKLKVKLVAEGIDTLQQLSCLVDLKCFAGQGYLFSKPLPAKEFRTILSLEKCMPNYETKDNRKAFYEERRKTHRITFRQLLESNITIKKFKGGNLNLGDSKILIKNISPKGLCFISNVQIPVDKEIILQITTRFYDHEIVTYGNLVWSREKDSNLYEYGIKFKDDENQRTILEEKLYETKGLLKINTQNSMFISHTPEDYFEHNI